MSAPVICADPTIQDGLVIRWRCSTKGPAVLSASRNAVMIHGDVIVDDDLLQWVGAAMHARQMLQAGLRDDAKAMATHRWTNAFGGDLVPVKPADASDTKET